MNEQKLKIDLAPSVADPFIHPGREIKEKRTSSAKVYSLGAGRYQAVLYPEPVHYQNESGEWLEINSAEMPESGLQAEQGNDLVPGSVSAAATAQTGAAMVMNYVSSKRPANTYAAGYNTNIAHNDYTWGKCDTFLRFDASALPPIDSSYYVTGATLTMRATKDNANEIVYLKEVLAPWDGATLTYNNRPAVASMPLDFQRALNYEYAVLEYNIANLVRKWYNGENYGLMLETLDGGLVQLGGATASYHKPYITIEYISLAGLEDYLAQETHPCGRAGTASVGLFNGNLVFAHQETRMNGNLLPVSIARYYNSCYHDENPFGAGAGWKFSAQQTLHKETLDSVVHYVYMDGDGTRHHFKKESGAWRDLSGLSLKLELDEEAGTATITDKGDNTLTFPLPTAEFNENYDNVKMIQSMADAVGNQVSFAWNGRTLSSVTDGAGRLTNATISNGLVSTVTAPGMPLVSYSYANGHLTAITHEDGKRTTYAYNANGLLCEIENHDGTSLQIAYYNTREPFRVKQVTYLANNQAYAGRFYEYGDCRTTVSEMYPDEYGNLVTGKTLTYHFNDQGNIVSVNDELGYGCFAGYSANAPTNHPSYVSRMQRAVTNHLQNHHFQRTWDNTWTVDLMDGAGSCLYSSDEMFMGGRAYKMNKTSADGRISIHQMTLVPVEQQYTLSCYYKTQGDAAFQLRAEWPTQEGVAYVESVPVQSSDGWDRATLSFSLPEVSGDQLTVRLMACGGAGTVWLDCAQLEDGPVPNRYNMIEDGTFECYADGELLHWTPGEYNTDADRLYGGPSAPRPASLSGNVLRLYGDPNTHKYFQQSFSCIGPANDSFVMGGWSMSYSCPRDDDRPRQYEMLLLARPDPLEYQAGGAFEGKQLQSNGYPFWEEVATLRWSDEWSGWHFAARPVTIPWRYMEVGVRLVYRNNYNFAEFSNIFLHQEEFGSTFTYDENANVTSKKGTAALKRRAEYDDHDNPTALYAPGRDVPTRLFWSIDHSDAEEKQHLLRKSISPLGIVSKTAYDLDMADEANPKGLPLEKRVENTNSSLFIAGKTEYTANKNYISRQVDARNKAVTTVTDPNKGTVTSVIDPNKEQTPCGFVPRKHTRLQMAGAYPAS